MPIDDCSALSQLSCCLNLWMNVKGRRMSSCPPKSLAAAYAVQFAARCAVACDTGRLGSSHCSAPEVMTMATTEIRTAGLNLVLQTPEEVLAQVEAMSPADRAEVSPDWLARIRATAAGDPWSLGFTSIERESASAVGYCAFKGPPFDDGVVEVAYGINPEFRGKGYATEAAQALTEFALASGQVRLVRAH